MADTPKSFMNFAPGFRWPNESSIPPQTVLQALNIPVHDLAALAGVPPSTVTEKPDEPRLQKYLRDTLSARSASFELTHDREQSINWFRTAAIPELDHQTAEKLVAAGQVEAIVQYLASSASGSSG